LPVGRCPSAVARRPSPICHYSLAIAHHPWWLPFIHHRCLLSKEFFYGDGTVSQFFSCCLLTEFFQWRWDNETFFSFCLLST
jgi:hypothetical protein